MANIWTDKRAVNNENSQYAPIKSKQTLVSGNRHVHKLAFNEIKNVMHNQIGATPLKGNASKIDGLPSIFNPSKSLCNEVLRKQQLKQNFAVAQNKFERKLKTEKTAQSYKGPVFDKDDFDSWDRNRECCKNNESDAAIWSQMDAIDMELSMSKLNQSFHDDDIKPELLVNSDGLPDLEYLPDILNFPDFDLVQEETKSDFELWPKMIPNFVDELPF